MNTTDTPLMPLDLGELLRSIEDRYIDAALEKTGGNRQAAAKLLGLRRTTLVEKLKRRSQRNAPQTLPTAEPQAQQPST